MKRNKAIAVVLAFAICLLLCGCDMFTIDTEPLITPPELAGDMQPINEALKKSINGDFRLKYPSLGERRSAIILEDIDGNGGFEAFAFYSTSDDEMTNMHINAICKRGGEYVSVDEKSIVAGAVERVDFCDLDGDGAEEILVGWEVYGSSEKQLCVYSLTGDNLTVRLSEKYTGFICCDLVGDGDNELIIHLLNTADMINSAAVYRFTDGGLQKIAGCVLDSTVKTVSEPVFSKLSNGKGAIYIDEIKGAGAVTEVLYFESGELKNPLLETENTIENIRTLRSASIFSKDIDSDGVLEIPVATKLSNAAGTDEQLYYTNWCAFDGENLVTEKISILNTIDGYSVDIPENLEGRLAVLKDNESHRRVFYYYNSELDTVGERLFSISVVPVLEWDSRDYDRMSNFELARSGKNVFVASVNTVAKNALSEDALKEMFRVAE